MAKKFFNRNYIDADSKWEKEDLIPLLGEEYFHKYVIPYTWKREYHPDFTFITTHNEPRTIHVEAKGRFMDRLEATKYIWIREALGDKEELIFLFQKPNTPFPHAKKRKDGTIYTHAEWADKNGFVWACPKNIKTLLYKKGVRL